MSAMTRVALGLEYDGTAYNGWQIQPHAPSVQQCLQDALAAILPEDKVSCVAAGRTDTGVHASAQVVHFDTRVCRKPRAWVLGLNSHLPADIAVLWARTVPNAFHARYCAVRRSYRYRILNRLARTALLRHRVWVVHRPLDEERMAEAARYLLGTHDFSAFRAAGCQSKSPVREMIGLRVARRGPEIIVDCEANAFLHHMVRNIVGTLVQVGLGRHDPAWVGELLERRDRRRSGMTAPAAGLSLTGVFYPPEFDVPPASVERPQAEISAG